MKVVEPMLAVLVVSLAAFVATQATVIPQAGDDEAAGTLATAPHVMLPTGGMSEGTSTRTGSGDAGMGPLTSGRAEGRLSSRPSFVLDVPRDAAWSGTEMRRRLGQGAAGTYIGELLRARDSVITRWPSRLVTPLRVWVGDGGVFEGWQSEFPTIVRAAFDEWAATGIPVRFTYVRDSAGADVRVRFVSEFPQGISGRTIWSRDSAWWLVGGDIDLALAHPAGGAVSTVQLRAIALHEIGHLLGLDHVDDPSHIMAPRVRVRTLSETDRATIRLLYSVPAGSARN